MRDVRVDIIPGLVKEQALQFNLCEREITFTMALPTRSQNETVAYPQSIPGSQKGASMNLMPGDGFEGNAIMDKQGKKDQSRSSCQHSSLKTPQQCSSTRNRSNFTPLLNFVSIHRIQLHQEMILLILVVDESICLSLFHKKCRKPVIFHFLSTVSDQIFKYGLYAVKPCMH